MPERCWLCLCGSCYSLIAVIRSEFFRFFRLSLLFSGLLMQPYVDSTDLYSSEIKRNERQLLWSCSTTVQRTFPDLPLSQCFHRLSTGRNALTRFFPEYRCHKTFNDPKLGKRAWLERSRREATQNPLPFSIVVFTLFAPCFSPIRLGAGLYSLL